MPGGASRPATPAAKRMLYATVRADPATIAGEGERAAGALVDEDVEVGLLGDEPEQQRDACHRSGGDDGDAEHEPPLATRSWQGEDVAGPELVVDDADDHERGRLEGAVGEQHHAAGDLRRRCAPAEDGDHQPELAHRAVGEEQLEVGPPQRPQPAADQRHHADRDDQSGARSRRRRTPGANRATR